MSTPFTIECSIHLGREGQGARKTIDDGPASPEVEPGRLPRVTRLMALAIRFEQLIQDGIVEDYAELARLGHVTRARLTQIMNLRLLAPDIQESLLDLPLIHQGKDPIALRHLQPICLEPDWNEQRRMWRQLVNSSELM